MIIQGHVIDELKKMSAESVHCVITSPPYWGLRKYDIPDVVFDGDEGCEHEWGDEIIQKLRTKPGVNAQCGNTLKEVAMRERPEGQFCLHCSAWRGQLGLEPTPELYVKHIVEIFGEVRRVLRKDGTCWLNLGDSYNSSGTKCSRHWDGRAKNINEQKHLSLKGNINGLKPKDLVGIPWHVAFALQADGWYLRSDIIWSKPNPMPESVTDRPTKAHEYIFLLSKSQHYFWDQEAVKVSSEMNESSKVRAVYPRYRKSNKRDDDRGKPDFLTDPEKGYWPSTRNLRTVWTIATQSYSEAHFATFPEKLVEPMIKAGTSERGCCPKCGSPWERVVEKVSCGKAPSNTKFDKTMQGGPLSGSRQAYRRVGMEGPPPTKTIGWQPMCKCSYELSILSEPFEPIPCTVLDPFAGSGTVSRVSERLNRNSIGIDLGYSELQEKRTRNLQKELGGLCGMV